MLRLRVGLVRASALKEGWAGLHNEALNHAFHDTDRAVIGVAGPDAKDFLQGLTTNDVTQLTVGTPIQYTAFLSPKGRYLYDAFLYDRGSDVLLDVDINIKSALLNWLHRYKLRRAVQVQDFSDDLQPWACLNPSPSSKIGNWCVDPRIAHLGLRTIFSADNIPSTSQEQESQNRKEYFNWRMRHGVAQGAAEIVSGKANPIEYNLDGLNGFSYSKGCYIGQERMSHTHYRGVIRKRLMPALIEGNDGCKAGDLITLQGKKDGVGTIQASGDSEYCLAFLRLSAAFEAMKEESCLKIGSSVLKPYIPDWWPEEWHTPPE